MSRAPGSRSIGPFDLHYRPAGFARKALDNSLELPFTECTCNAQNHHGRIVSNGARTYITIGAVLQILLKPGQPRTSCRDSILQIKPRFPSYETLRYMCSRSLRKGDDSLTSSWGRTLMCPRQIVRHKIDCPYSLCIFSFEGPPLCSGSAMF